MIIALLVLMALLIFCFLLIVGRALKIVGEDSSWPKTVTCFSCGQVISEAVAGDHDCTPSGTSKGRRLRPDFHGMEVPQVDIEEGFKRGDLTGKGFDIGRYIDDEEEYD